MMRLFRRVLFLSIVCLLAGCTNEDAPKLEDAKGSRVSNPYRVNVSDAVSIADKMMAEISSAATRGNRSVSEISVIKGVVATRAFHEESDTLLYIINYQGNAGFAIVAADSRAIPVYAISDSGHFQINEDSNPAIGEMLAYAAESVKYHAQGIGSIGPIGPITPPDIPVTPIDLQPYKKIAPMISQYQSRISPYGKYSKYVVNEYGEPALTCCVSVAIEIVMSYYKWPEQLEGYSFDWDAMNNGNDDDGIARLLAILSSKNYACVEHNNSTYGGEASFNLVPRTFLFCGYELPHDTLNFYSHEEKIIRDMANGPLLFRADPSDEKMTAGHAWVVDGLLQYLIGDGTFTPSEGGGLIPNLVDCNYYHCVWGDSGNCNGYYLVADHDFNGAPDKFDPIDSGETDAAKYRDYSKKIVFISNFKPKKQ